VRGHAIGELASANCGADLAATGRVDEPYCKDAPALASVAAAVGVLESAPITRRERSLEVAARCRPCLIATATMLDVPPIGRTGAATNLPRKVTRG
jgi:hypothetical protein